MTAPADSADANRRKRVLFRAWHRGILETDLILGPFAEAHVAALDSQELDDFETLLSAPDGDLHAWFTGRSTPPERFNRSLIERIRAHTQRPIP